MYRTIIPDGEISCASYSHSEKGIELYTDDDDFIAFVPYNNLVAVINEDVYNTDERSIM